jgi:hypothetical protein
MSEGGNGAQMPEQQRKRISLLLQVMGIFDIVLGAALAVFGPMIIAGDATSDSIWMIMGGALALGGIAIWWFGRFRFGAKPSDQGTVVRR